MSADGGVLMHVGVMTPLAAVTSPVNPNGGGGGTKAETGGGGGTTPGTTGVAGTTGGGGGGTEPAAGAGGGGAGGGGAGGGGGKLPFTGFPAAIVAGLGAGLALGGKRLRELVGRESEQSSDSE